MPIRKRQAAPRQTPAHRRRPWRVPWAVLGLLLSVGLLVYRHGPWQGRVLPPPPPVPVVATVNDGPREMTARVIEVIDGDTIRIDGGERVRYIGIDAPEMHYQTGAPDPRADAARQANARFVGQRTVRLVFDAERRDRYHRLLAYVYADGRLVNLALVAQGWAWARAYPPNTAHRAEFEAAAQQARAQCLGIWQGER